MYTESDLLPLSALQHYAFCPRQCALIHNEQQWSENRLTAEGRLLHERVHEQETSSRKDIIIARGLRLRSLQLGFAGQADVVEFHYANSGLSLPGRNGRWMPFPVEYKRGKPKKNNCDKVQLCAQVLCLEEMLDIKIPAGALFYGKTKRRLDVAFVDTLRDETRNLAQQVHQLFSLRAIPAPINDSRCRQCSIRDECMPNIQCGKGYLLRQIHASLEYVEEPA